MKKRYILAVDDDPYWRTRLEEALCSLGYRLLIASGIHEAEDLLEEHENEIALVVCDNNMPLGGRPFPNAGIEILEGMRILNESRAAIPFILHTSEASEDQRMRVADQNGVVLIKRHEVSDEVLTRKAQEML